MVLQPLCKDLDHNFRKPRSSLISLGFCFQEQWRCYCLETTMFWEFHVRVLFIVPTEKSDH